MDTHRIDPSSMQTEKAEGEVATVAQRVSSIVDRLPSQKLEAAYVPQVVSLGPLHFGNPQLGKYETFKDELPHILVDRAGRPPFKNLVADMIVQGSKIRQWYEHLHIWNDMSDEELGWILARDGLFLLRFLRYKLPRMRVFKAMGRELEAGHMPSLRHHMALHARGRIDHTRFKTKGPGTAAVNARRVHSIQSNAAVMADGIPSRVGDDEEHKSGLEQGMWVVLHSAGLSVVEAVPSQTIGSITRLVLVIDSLVHLAVSRESHPTMVRPRQRMLSRRGSSRGGGSRRPERDDAGHCCHCNLASSIGAIPLHSDHHMDVGASSSATLPAFGSTIFNFTSSTANPRISAHVSILFIENPPEADDPIEAQEQGMQDYPGEAEQAPTAELEQEEKGRATVKEKSKHSQNAPNAAIGEAEATPPTEAEPDYYGWCPIVEEQPDEPNE